MPYFVLAGVLSLGLGLSVVAVGGTPCTAAPMSPSLTASTTLDNGRWCTVRQRAVFDPFHNERYTVDETVCLR
ncbi:MAG: hypothetical protein AAF318_19165 [Pseudomonadota bacterium]